VFFVVVVVLVVVVFSFVFSTQQMQIYQIDLRPWMMLMAFNLNAKN